MWRGKGGRKHKQQEKKRKMNGVKDQSVSCGDRVPLEKLRK
jgi:hypothetical protein